MKNKASKYFKELQHRICAELELTDGQAKFIADEWERPDLNGTYGGGGLSCVMTNGGVFEKAGVNFSQVSGNLPEKMTEQLTGQTEDCSFFATGVSLVLHPYSPMVPTTHANVRYLEVANKAWFGGGSDLTPYYLFTEDAKHFHQTFKDVCDQHDQDYYPKFKKWCDEYFYLPHRQEARGIGGLFFDYIGREEQSDLEKIFSFVQDIGNGLMTAYLPIVNKRKGEAFTEAQKNFQLQRRGRYVEFNLLYDRGTQFGLATNGRTESILMSLPPLVRWDYCAEYDQSSREAELLNVLRKSREWL